MPFRKTKRDDFPPLCAVFGVGYGFETMLEIGLHHPLRILREARPGFYLDGENLGEILMPRRYITPTMAIGDEVEVFVYRDSEERLVATTETPYATVGQFAGLEVLKADPRLGAFLDWGISKDLLLPMREQGRKVEEGEVVVVYIFVDVKSERIVATTKFAEYMDPGPPPYEEGQKVQVLVAGETPLGYKAIVEGTHWGLFYRTDLGVPMSIGQQVEAYVRMVRPDRKIDLSLDTAGRGRVPPLAHQILAALEEAKGFLPLNDNSPAEVIRERFGTSKKAFKQAIGLLYRERKIRFADGGIAAAK